MEQHTPGQWSVITLDGTTDLQIGARLCNEHGLRSWDTVAEVRAPAHPRWRADAQLLASAPDLLACIEREYTTLADIRNEWPGRHTLAGQRKLCDLRDLICKATGRDAQDVQDDYTARATGTAS